MTRFVLKPCGPSRTIHQAFERIPSAGPTLIVCGQKCEPDVVSDLLTTISRVRRDVHIIAGGFTAGSPRADDLFWYIAPLPCRPPRLVNYSVIRLALRWLRNGGCLLVFPTADATHWAAAQTFATSNTWTPALARVIRAHRAVAIPAAAKRSQQGKPEVDFGEALIPPSLSRFSTDRELAAYLRWKTASLHRSESAERLVPRRTA